MLSMIAAVAALALAQQQTDTTVPVARGARLQVNNFGGEIVVRAWTESRVRVRATHSGRDEVTVSAGATRVRVESSGRRGPPHPVEYEISVPAWMSVTLSGTYTDIRVFGVDAEISGETVEGDVEIEGGSGRVELKSIEGDVRVTGAKGRISVGSVDGDVRLSTVSGDLTVESVDGDIVIDGGDLTTLDASTVDGDITYLGTLKDGGNYTISTHDGDVAVAVPERTNATFSVATFSGDFDASFPIQLSDTHRRRFSFTLGSGSARVELETFDGEIQLRRSGEIRAPRDEGRNKDKSRTRNRDNDRDNDFFDQL